MFTSINQVLKLGLSFLEWLLYFQVTFDFIEKFNLSILSLSEIYTPRNAILSLSSIGYQQDTRLIIAFDQRFQTVLEIPKRNIFRNSFPVEDPLDNLLDNVCLQITCVCICQKLCFLLNGKTTIDFVITKRQCLANFFSPPFLVFLDEILRSLTFLDEFGQLFRT